MRSRRRSLAATLHGALHGVSLKQDLPRLRRALSLLRQPPRPRPPRRRRAPAALLTEFLEDPDSPVSVTEGALLIAEESRPGLDIDAARRALDELARELRPLIRRASGPDRARILCRALFGNLGFTACDDRDLESPLALLLLPDVLERKRGHCLGLTTLLVALGERLGIPLHAVSLPGHVFCRYDDRREVLNLETTLAGAEWSDARYVRRARPQLVTDAEVSPELIAQLLEPLDARGLLVEILNNRGNDFWRRGRQEDAARDLIRATRARPDFARGHAGKGFLALCRGELDIALVELARALELDETDERSRLLLGEALLERGHYGRALDVLELCAARRPESAFTRSLIGRAKARLGDIDGAREAHAEALRLDDAGGLVWNNVGVFLARTGEPEVAIDAFLKALARAPELAAAAENLARLARRRPELLDAELRARIVTRLRDRLATARSPRGAALTLATFLLESEGAVAEARELAERAHATKAAAASAELLARIAWRERELIHARRRAIEGLALLPGARLRRRLHRRLAKIDRSLSLACGL